MTNNQQTSFLTYLLPLITKEEINEIIYTASKNGDMTTLDKFTIDYNYIMYGASESNNLKLFINAIEKGADDIDIAMDIAINNKSLNIIKYILKKHINQIDIQSCMSTVAFKGNLKILNLLSKYEVMRDDYVFPRILYSKHIHIIKWLLDKKVITPNDIYSAMDGDPRLLIVEMLLDRDEYPPDDVVENILISSYIHNRFDIIKALLIKNNLTIDLINLVQYNFDLTNDQHNFFLDFFSHESTNIDIERSYPSLVTYTITNPNVNCKLFYIRDLNDRNKLIKLMDSIFI